MQAKRGAAVTRSEDFSRIAALARRPPIVSGTARAEALVELVTARYRRPDRPLGAPCGCRALGRSQCIDRLLPAQAWALYEAPLAGGLLAPIGVGEGKTILDILMAVAMGSKTAVLLVPPGLVGQLADEYLAVREHFRVPSIRLPDSTGHLVVGAPSLHVVPYSIFQRAGATDMLTKLDPDLLLADECHSLKNREATRTGRVLRHLALGNTRLCGWSGTITSNSLQDFAHLLAFMLGMSSPLPLDPEEVGRWAAAVDPSDWPADPGPLCELGQPGDSALEAVGRRIRETRGVVSSLSSPSSCKATLTLRSRAPKLPRALAELRAEVRSTWTRSDGEEFVEADKVATCVSQLACGFFYRWRFPGKPSEELVYEWFAARKAWKRELRVKLQDPVEGLDSPLLCALAAERAVNGYSGPLLVWESEAWERWRDVKHRVKYVNEAVWVDDFLVKDAGDWLSKNLGIVWFKHRTFGEALAKFSGAALHTGGPDAEAKIKAEKGDRSLVAAIGSHGEGRNGLQRLFNRQLVANPPGSGKLWEQLLGRLHRTGQPSDEVVTDIFRHVPEYADSIDFAVRQAKYVEGLLTAEQKLLRSDVEWEVNRRAA